MKSLFKSLLFYFLYILKPDLISGASILMYHSIGTDNAFFTVRPEVFERQMRYLKEKKYTILSLSELIAKIKKNESLSQCVCITFDDGYINNLENALPILKKYHIPATIFIPTGLLEKTLTASDGVTLPIMSKKNLTDSLQSSLLEYMPHAYSHIPLTHMSLSEAQKEIDTSVHEIQNISHVQDTVFAFPKGKYTPEIIDYVRLQRDIMGAVTVHEGVIHTGDDIYMLKRNSIDSSTTFSQFITKVSDAIDLYEYIKKIFKK